jgi:hypothetical protein
LGWDWRIEADIRVTRRRQFETAAKVASDFERDLRGLSQKYRSRAMASGRNPSARSERFSRVSSEEAAICQSHPKLTDRRVHAVLACFGFGYRYAYA